jgi:hypothetical protein
LEKGEAIKVIEETAPKSINPLHLTILNRRCRGSNVLIREVQLYIVHKMINVHHSTFDMNHPVINPKESTKVHLRKFTPSLHWLCFIPLKFKVCLALF